MKMKRN